MFFEKPKYYNFFTGVLKYSLQTRGRLFLMAPFTSADKGIKLHKVTNIFIVIRSRTRKSITFFNQ